MIGSTPVIQYVGDVIIAELKAIHRPTYITDVSTAEWAPFDFDDEAILTAAAIGPCFFVWLNPITFSENQIGGGTDRISVNYGISGAVQNSKDVQAVTMGLITDLYRVMRNNPIRTFPGETGGNNYCENTYFRRLVPRFGRLASSMGYGLFDSEWTCDVRFPRATG